MASRLPGQFLNITFLSAGGRYRREFGGEVYCVIGEDDVGNFVGEDKQGVVWLLDTAAEEGRGLVYLARDRRTLAAAIGIYRRHRLGAMAAALVQALLRRGDSEEEQARAEAAGLRESLSALDPAMLRDEGTFWSPLLDEIEWGMM